jgi:tetratricopeptide (TPR) repeat protein
VTKNIIQSGLGLRMKRLNELNKVQKKATPSTDGQNPVRPNVLDSLKLDQAIRLAKKKAKAGSPEDAKLIYNDILGRFPKNKRALDGIKSLVVGLIGKASKVKEPPQDQQQRLINLFQQGQLQQALDSAKQLLLQFPDSLTVYNVQGAANAGLGQLDAAIGSYKQALKIKPDYADAYNNMGVALKNKGDLEAAIGSYNKALKIKPDYADAYNNMGLALQGNGDLEAAIDSYQQALKIKPDYVEAYYNMGLALQDKGDLEAAIVSYQQAIKIKPDYAEAHNTMGIALNDKGDLETAIDIYQKAIKIKPDYADAYNNMGLALMAKDDLDAGLANFKQALNIRPDYAEAYYNMGNALNEKGDLETAIDSYQKAIKIKPDYTEAYNNMGLALIDKGNLDAAIGNFKQALKIKPDFADAYNNMGVALREKGQLASSIDSLKQAIKIRPNFAEAFHNLSYPYFLQGSVEKGFNFYESRLRQTKSTAAPTRAHLIWDGKKSLSGKHFVIYEEQGLGDMIQFCRYLPLLEQKGADITFKVKSKLHALLQTMDSNIRLVTSFPKENKIDFEAPLMSLPHLLGTSLETIPAATPYLFADQEKIRTWGERMSTDRFKVGICWQGSTAKAAIGRSFPLSIFEGISSIPNIELISLHQGAGEAQMAGIDFDVTTLGHDFDTGQYAFLDTAAVMMNCDLIITCDTSIAHLASAIGRPTWLVLKQIPHWVWMLDRSDSPWYPTITLYRQKSQGDWVDVFETIKRDLSSMLQQKKEVK